ncbi:uncharacterized protein FFFS_08674 [Fusarium fujikuroi]|uniref:Cupin type-2 domain-containing protein n=1 Tax=Fusarium fujikuroi TaxID=5127 RepID=A0A9Q9RUL8_FUSFU|nr:uncharacterized protein FFFS_08674 [Fusarium fujikuroi]VTT76586.1 unnamed protein product [Fusarium fujikuroi]
MPSSKLAPVRRIVIGHDNNAHSTIKYDSQLMSEHLTMGVEVKTLWITDTFPANTNIVGDPTESHSGFMAPGSLIRVVDFPPQSQGATHRTVSLDYIILVKGSLVHWTDDGSTTTVNEGDVLVQQGTMHRWDNNTDEWARIVCIILPATEPVVNGPKLGDDSHLIGLS